jgi:hypothetical protein
MYIAAELVDTYAFTVFHLLTSKSSIISLIKTIFVSVIIVHAFILAVLSSH